MKMVTTHDDPDPLTHRRDVLFDRVRTDCGADKRKSMGPRTNMRRGNFDPLVEIATDSISGGYDEKQATCRSGSWRWS